MSVSIQDVLALLPELFPGTQEVPLANIRLNPDNPGPAASDEEIADLAANIEAVGLKNPVKLRPEPTGPLAPGVTLHLDNPRLRGDGQPWRVADFIYRLMSGQSRYQAFRKLQRPTIPSGIQNPTEEEAVIIGRTDNRVRDKGWWADYQDVENLIRATPNLTQDLIAVKLKMDRKKVNRAIGLLPLLNPQSRTLISGNAANSNKGNKALSDIAASELAVLGPGTGLKPGVRKEGSEIQRLWPYPAIPPETQDLVRRALAVAIDREMTQTKVRAMAGWVKEGNRPEEYPTKGLAAVHPMEGQVAQPKRSTEKASIAAQAPTPSKVPEQAGAPAHPSHGSRLGASIREWWPEVKTFLLSQFKRTLGSLLRRWIMTGLGALVVILLLSPHLYVSLYHFVADYVKAPKQAAPPSLAGSSPVDVDSRMVQSFAEDFYGTDYTDIESWQAFMEHPIDPAYRPAFYQAFYPPSKIEAVRKLRLKESFQAAQPPQLLSSDKDGKVFLIQGRASLQSDLKSPGQVVAEGPVALEVHVVPVASKSTGGKIIEVKETTALAYDWAASPVSTAAEKSKSGALSAKASQKGNSGGIQYVATVQVPVKGTTVTGIVDSKGVTVKSPKVFGVSLPSVSIPNPLGGF